MKQIRSMLAGGLLVFGAAAVASAQATQTAPNGQHAHGQRGQAGARGERGPGARGARALFRGIQLSDAEKANIKNVNAKYAPQMKALREQFKPAQQGKIAKGDTAARRAQWEQNKPLRDQMQKLMQSERADLRAALSPENQAKFDTNVQQAEARFAQRGQGKAGKGFRRGPGAGK